MWDDASISSSLRGSIRLICYKRHTSNKLVGKDRPKLLLEVFAVLTVYKCIVINVEIQKHNDKATTIIQATGYPNRDVIEDPKWLPYQDTS